MEDSQENDKAEYVRKLAEALEGGVSALSEVATIDLRRRMNAASAIIRFASAMFYRTETKKLELKRRQESRVPLIILVLSVSVGVALDYLFPDLEKGWGVFKQGAIICTVGILYYAIHAWETCRQGQDLARDQTQVDELLYRWIANGGSEDRFWSLRDQVDGNLGGVDYDTGRYRSWWYEIKADLLDSVNGQPPGTGAWRPRYFGW